jgi:hypothetical protein
MSWSLQTVVDAQSHERLRETIEKVPSVPEELGEGPARQRDLATDAAVQLIRSENFGEAAVVNLAGHSNVEEDPKVLGNSISVSVHERIESVPADE